MAWWLRGAAPIARRDWLGVAALGFLGYYAASLLDFLALQYVSAGLGRLIMFLYPTIVVILSALFLSKSPRQREVAALGITYAGIALVLSQQFGATPEQRMFLFGALLVFSSAICYAVYLVADSQLVRRVGSLRFTAYTMIVSTLPAVVQFALLESPAALELPQQVWWYVMLLAIGCTVIPVPLFHNGAFERTFNENGKAITLKLSEYESYLRRLVPDLLLKVMGYDDGHINWNRWLDRQPFR